MLLCLTKWIKTGYEQMTKIVCLTPGSNSRPLDCKADSHPRRHACFTIYLGNFRVFKYTQGFYKFVKCIDFTSNVHLYFIWIQIQQTLRSILQVRVWCGRLWSRFLLCFCLLICTINRPKTVPSLYFYTSRGKQTFI